MIRALKTLVPRPLLQAYHLAWALFGALYYRFPSRKLHVIGVTGTNGKSSTTHFIAQLLDELGETVGFTSSHAFSIAGRERINDYKMGMLGRGKTQGLLREMVDHKCTYAVIETSSQGIDQHRHRFIAYDTALITNLTPEHIEAHGGFEAYKAAKMKLFSAVAKRKRKVLAGHPVLRRIVVNGNDEHAPDFASQSVDRTIAFQREDKDPVSLVVDRTTLAKQISMQMNATEALIDGQKVSVPLLGSYYFSNALAAIATVVNLGFDLVAVLEAAKALKPIPGRLERIEHAGVQIVIDYAPEPYSLEAMYEAIEPLKAKRIIHVGGACGGGRDTWKWDVLGKMAAERDDVFIVTNEDPYDDDPMMIIDAIADAAVAAGMQEGERLFRVLDRQEAITKAVKMAKKGDVVVLTGKGSEPVMAMAGGKLVPWSERKAVENAIRHD